jgi:hypothetical protein
MRRGVEPGHVQADLGQDRPGCGDPDAGDRIKPSHRLGERGDLGVEPFLHGGDVGGDRVDAVQHARQQERVVVGEPAGQRLGEAGGLGTQGAAGQIGQHARVALAGDQRGHDRPFGDRETGRL